MLLDVNWLRLGLKNGWETKPVMSIAEIHALEAGKVRAGTPVVVVEGSIPTETHAGNVRGVGICS